MKGKKVLAVLAMALFCLVSCDGGHNPPPPPTTTTTIVDNTTTTTIPGQFKGMVSVTFDDGTRLSENVINALNANWISATFYVITGQVGTEAKYFGWSDIINLYESGHEIGNHTASHKRLICSEDPDNCYGSDEAYLADVTKAQDEFLAQGLPEVKSYAYPYGSISDPVIKLLQGTGFITSARQAYVDGETFNTKANFNAYKLNAVSIRKSTLSQIPGLIDQAIAQDVWLILVFHTVSVAPNPADELDISEEDASQIFQKISSTDIYSVQVSDGLKKMLGQ